MEATLTRTRGTTGVGMSNPCTDGMDSRAQTARERQQPTCQQCWSHQAAGKVLPAEAKAAKGCLDKKKLFKNQSEGKKNPKVKQKTSPSPCPSVLRGVGSAVLFPSSLRFLPMEYSSKCVFGHFISLSKSGNKSQQERFGQLLVQVKEAEQVKILLLLERIHLKRNIEI